MMNHVAYEVDGKTVDQEVRFWEALGWSEMFIRSRTAPVSRWLQSPRGEGSRVFIHLLLRKDAKTDWTEGAFHLCVLAANRAGGFDGVMTALDKLDFAVPVEEAEKWWGARRMFLVTPAGVEVELLEHEPAAGRPMPPETD